MTITDEWIARLRSGDRDLANAELAGVNLERANLGGVNLEGANLLEANLVGAHFERARLAGANFERGQLAGARFIGAHLVGANFSGAELVGAHFERANLGGSNFRDSNLTRANLMTADLQRAKLRGANFRESILGYTVLADVWLGSLCSAKGLVFRGPCTVDDRSIVRSVKEPGLKNFLRSCGIPEVFVEYMVDCARSLDPGTIFSLMQSTFISYGSPDEAFAVTLNDALKGAGVTTFFFPDDAVPGETLRKTMHRGVNDHDRVILVCSRDSLDRKGLLNELEETLRREARDGGNAYLIPVRLDDYVLTWRPQGREDIAQTVRDRVIADFRGWSTSASVFPREISKLIRALKKPPEVNAR
jgi:hypothetical protein